VDPLPSGEPDPRYAYQQSILDLAASRTEALMTRVGSTDRQKLDEYLTAVRNVEQRVALLADGSLMPIECTIPDMPPPDTSEQEIPFTEHLDLLSDLIALSFQCDVTRVATFMFEHSFSDDRNFSFLPGVTGRHHSITHDAEAQDQEEIIDRFYVERFAYLMGRLKNITETDSTVLNHSITYFTSEFGNGSIHDFRNAAMLVAGTGGGRLQTGLHVQYPLAAGDGTGADGRGNPDDVQLAQLHLTTLRAFGLDTASFGQDDVGTPIATTTLSDIEA
jgi:hypothetical protein